LSGKQKLNLCQQIDNFQASRFEPYLRHTRYKEPGRLTLFIIDIMLLITDYFMGNT